MVPFFYRPCAQGKNLGAIDELDQVLDKDKDSKRGQEEDQIRRFLSS